MSRFTRSITVLFATIYNTFPPANSNLGIKSNLHRSLFGHCIHLQSTPRNSNHRPTLLQNTQSFLYTRGRSVIKHSAHLPNALLSFSHASFRLFFVPSPNVKGSIETHLYTVTSFQQYTFTDVVIASDSTPLRNTTSRWIRSTSSSFTPL